MTTASPRIGDVVTCAETGKSFIAAIDGCTTNYATDREGNVYSDEGVALCERRAIREQQSPVIAYVSSDWRTITTWKGAALMTVAAHAKCPLPFGQHYSVFHGEDYSHIWAKDSQGRYWYGRSSNGVAIALRPLKRKPKHLL
jgi:hypothetical protein